MENCRLAGLPDLDQSHSFVSSALTKWVQDTVKEFEFDGLRVDTTHMVSKEFWLNYSKASGVYTVGEVFNTDPGYISGYQVFSWLVNSKLYLCVHLGSVS